MINVEKIFGIGSVRNHKNLQLVVELVHNETLSQESVNYFDTPVLKVQIQVEAGRNIATLIETAALNYRLKLLGQDATVEFEARLKNTLKRG
jgi:HPr kinase/phosphorylase